MALSIATLKSVLKNFCDTKPGSWYEIRAWYNSLTGMVTANVAWDEFYDMEVTSAQKAVWDFLGLNLSADDRQGISRIECGEDCGVADQLDPNPILSHAVNSDKLATE